MVFMIKILERSKSYSANNNPNTMDTPLGKCLHSMRHFFFSRMGLFVIGNVKSLEINVRSIELFKQVEVHMQPCYTVAKCPLTCMFYRSFPTSEAGVRSP